MLSVAESALLSDFTRALTRHFRERFVGAVLFGSRARGEGHEWSDLDVLVLVRDVTKAERRAILDLACEHELSSGFALSPLVRDARTPALGAALRAEIDRDGVRL